jgi:hypothetical protein
MDPHVSGGWVSYTDDATGLLVVHYYNLATGQDAGSGNPPAALDPPAECFRVEPGDRGDTVAWDDFTVNPTSPQIMVEDLATQTMTDLSNDPTTARTSRSCWCDRRRPGWTSHPVLTRNRPSLEGWSRRCRYS